MKTGPDLLQEFLKPGKAFEESNLSFVVSAQTETAQENRCTPFRKPRQRRMIKKL